MGARARDGRGAAAGSHPGRVRHRRRCRAVAGRRWTPGAISSGTRSGTTAGRAAVG
jgi:hypothetical protein